MKFLVLVLMLLQACTGCASTAAAPTQSAPWLLFQPPPLAQAPDGPAVPRHAMVNINAEIDDTHAATWVRQIVDAAAQYDFVTIEINTGGGSNTAGFAILKAIEDCGKPTLCIVDGHAMSYGFNLLQSCTLRAMTKRSYLMVHESSYSISVDHANRHVFRDYYKALGAVDRAYAEHMARRLGMPVQELRRRIDNKEWYLNWDDALAYNAVDAVYGTVAIGLTKMQAKLAHPRP